MRVLFVDQFGELGGAQQCLLELLPAVVARGWSAFAAVPGTGLLAERLAACGAGVTRLDVAEYTRGSKGVGDALRFAVETPRLGLALRRLCARERIDLLYVNGPRMLPAAVLAGVPVLFHAHSVPGGRSLAVTRRAVRRAHVVAVSAFVAGRLGMGVVVPNGVADLRRPRVLGARPRVGVIGRIAPEKGQELFLAAARGIPDCDFVICGEASEPGGAYERRVRAAAEGLPVNLLGFRDDVAAVLAELDLLVVPSLGEEGFGRTVIEGFSAMVPVVAFGAGGIRELIEDGRTGYLVEPPSAEALAARVMAVLGRTEVVENARRVWEERYTLQHYTAAIMAEMVRAAG